MYVDSQKVQEHQELPKLLEYCHERKPQVQPHPESDEVILEFTGRWKNLHTVVNIEYLRPYSLRSDVVGPGPQSLSVNPISVEPYDRS